jgi:hypothetical protein
MSSGGNLQVGSNPLFSKLGWAAVLCLGVILVPFALLFLLLSPDIGATLGVLAVAFLGLGSVGVLGGF